MLAILKSFRFWAIAGLVTAILAFAKWGYDQVYDAGYQAAELKWERAQTEAVHAAVRRARAAWELAAETAEENIRVETQIIERTEYIEVEVPKIVERVVPAECRDLGPDIQRLFNDAISASAGTLPGATDSPEPAGPVSGP